MDERAKSWLSKPGAVVHRTPMRLTKGLVPQPWAGEGEEERREDDENRGESFG
jgi:hypothetical protein